MDNLSINSSSSSESASCLPVTDGLLYYQRSENKNNHSLTESVSSVGGCHLTRQKRKAKTMKSRLSPRAYIQELTFTDILTPTGYDM